MYGLVNKAVEELVCAQFGEAAWASILDRAGVDLDSFVSMQAYPDEVTYKLVRAASEVLQLSPAAVLEAFGQHWTLYTASEGYGELLAMFGDCLVQFLQNLDRLHAQVAVGFPELRPPSFRVEQLEAERALLLHYHSHREGLAPMVIGLVKGLATRFGESIEIRQVEERASNGHDVFRIELTG